eukprot:8821675-Prorocentrum_lima.AAC.1
MGNGNTRTLGSGRPRRENKRRTHTTQVHWCHDYPAKGGTQEYPGDTYVVGQGAYSLEVLG